MIGKYLSEGKGGKKFVSRLYYRWYLDTPNGDNDINDNNDDEKIILKMIIRIMIIIIIMIVVMMIMITIMIMIMVIKQ